MLNKHLSYDTRKWRLVISDEPVKGYYDMWYAKITDRYVDKLSCLISVLATLVQNHDIILKIPSLTAYHYN